jgi:predicted HicB family RNase H-like nuclease
MARREEHVWVQLSTRIPKELHRELRLHCVYAETSLMDFVSKALQEHLVRARGAPAKVRRKNA